MKKTLFTLIAFVALTASIALASQTVQLAAPATHTVTSTTFTTPAGFSIDTLKVNAGFTGGLSSMQACAASVTVKDASLAQLNVRVIFNGVAGAQPSGSPKTNADGSVTFTFVLVNPPNQSGVLNTKCRAQAQLSKKSTANPNVTLDPGAEGDILKFEA